MTYHHGQRVTARTGGPNGSSTVTGTYVRTTEAGAGRGQGARVVLKLENGTERKFFPGACEAAS